MSGMPAVASVLYEAHPRGDRGRYRPSKRPHTFLPDWLRPQLRKRPDVTDQGEGWYMADFYLELSEWELAHLLEYLGVTAVDAWEDGSPHSPLSPVFDADDVRLEVGGEPDEFRRVFEAAKVTTIVPSGRYVGEPVQSTPSQTFDRG